MTSTSTSGFTTTTQISPITSYSTSTMVIMASSDETCIQISPTIKSIPTQVSSANTLSVVTALFVTSLALVTLA